MTKDIIFVHANGYPPECYKDLLFNLKSLGKIHYINLPPLTRSFYNSDKYNNWIDFLNPMMEQIEKRKLKNIIAIGHSMGGVMSLVAANKFPDMFKNLILIDPTFLEPKYIYFSQFVPKFIQKKINPVYKKALSRKDHWESEQHAYNYLREKKIFELIPDQYFKNVIKGLCMEDKNGVILKYSKLWEAHCYKSILNPWPYIKKCQTPTLGIFGEYSTIINKSSRKMWKKNQTNLTLQQIENTDHLVPFQKPDVISKKILEFIKEK